MGYRNTYTSFFKKLILEACSVLFCIQFDTKHWSDPGMLGFVNELLTTGIP